MLLVRRGRDWRWNANIEAKRWKDSNTLPGWGARYKVRIFGRHSAVKEKQPDDSHRTSVDLLIKKEVEKWIEKNAEKIN